MTMHNIFTQHLRPRLLLLATAFLFSFSAFAQTTPSTSPGNTGGGVKGTLVDATTNEPLGFANVVIYTFNDSLVTGVTTDIDGKFNISDLPLGDYRLEASYIGYGTEKLNVELSEIERYFTLGDIELGTGGQDLDEVVVTAQRAVMELGRRPAAATAQYFRRPGRQRLPARFG